MSIFHHFISTRATTIAALLSVVCGLQGCGSVSMLTDGVKSLVGGTPEGEQIPKVVSLPPPQKSVNVSIEAAPTLNVDDAGSPLSVVVRVYKLRDASAFLRAPIEVVTDGAKAKEAFGTDIVETKEVVLVPGGRYELTELFDDEAKFYAVAVAFRRSDPRRWRYAFVTDQLVSGGLVLGVHGCSLTVAKGEPFGDGRSGAKIGSADNQCD